MHLASGNYFGLNAVASIIWNQLDEPRTIAAPCAAIQTAFEVDEAPCLANALEFPRGRIDDGLARVVETASTP